MIHIRSGICGTSVFDIYANGTSAKQDAGQLIRWAIHIVLLIKTYHSAAAWSMPSEICRAPERRAPKPILNMTNFHQ